MKIGLSLGKIIAFPVIIAVLALGFSHGALYSLAWRNIDELGRERARQSAENAASQLSSLIALWNQGLKGLAADSHLAVVIAKADPILLRAEEERITRAFPGALLVRLLPENVQTLDEARSPRMGFSDLNMIRSALNGAPQPAIHLANSPDVHLAMAQRLDNGGGVIHVSLPIRLLEDAMNVKGTCALALRQDIVLLAYRGGEKCQENDPDGEASVAGLPFNIVYWALRTVDVDGLGFVAVFSAFAVFLAVFAWAWHRFLT
ncbi:MAG: hypothetical protein PHE55_07815, partial [Methylococcaceae bacterium]|nr:hypothetical protein [Methylococcaceae bacterium]